MIQYFFIILLWNNHMESQVRLQKIKHASSRMNTIDSKAQSCIKRHQVREFINAGSKVSSVSVLENDQNSQLASHLLQLKTSCSGVKNQIKHREFEQSRYKDETNYIAEKVKSIQSQKNKLQAEVTKLQGLVEEVKSKQVNAVLCYKSYEHILDRMKKDQIRYQIKKNEMEKDLRALKKSLKEQKNKNEDLKQFEHMCSNGLKEAQEQIGELKKIRMNKLANMSRVVEEKQVLEKKKQERKDKSDMIKEMAAGDLQDADLIRLKKFLTVQVFLKTLLKGKIEKLKDFYEPYELAFLKIKSNTNVKDASSLKSEYHNFETTYNEKAAWVKHLEEEISKHQQRRKVLKTELSQLKLKEMEILEQVEQENQQTDNPIQKELQKKAEGSLLMMTEVREWLKQQALKIGLQFVNKSEGEMLKQIIKAVKKVQESKQSEITPSSQ